MYLRVIGGISDSQTYFAFQHLARKHTYSSVGPFCSRLGKKKSGSNKKLGFAGNECSSRPFFLRMSGSCSPLLFLFSSVPLPHIAGNG